MLTPNSGGLQLRCALEECQALPVPDVTTTVEEGDFGTVNGLVVIYVTSLAKSLSDYVAGLFYAPKILVPCAAAGTGDYLPGSKVYFDSADKEVNESSTGNKFVGIVLEQPEVGAEEVLIAFDSRLAL